MLAIAARRQSVSPNVLRGQAIQNAETQVLIGNCIHSNNNDSG